VGALATLCHSGGRKPCPAEPIAATALTTVGKLLSRRSADGLGGSATESGDEIGTCGGPIELWKHSLISLGVVNLNKIEHD